MIYLYLSFTFLILGIVLSFNRILGYSAIILGSVFSFITGIVCRGIFTIFTIAPGVTIGFSVDKTSAMFLIIASTAWIFTALYSIDYGRLYAKSMTLWFNISVFGMFIILTAADSITFIIGWEIMTVSAYLLVLEHRDSFKEAFKFLAFGEVSVIALILGFSFSFFINNDTGFAGLNKFSPIALGLLTFGFIVKMGIVPFHTWLIDAHSKAPANASALLSAPLTVMGIYGIERVLTGNPHVEYLQWWGVAAMILGSLSAFWGALHAASSERLKTLPAYSTVENNGMILTAIGFGVIAAAEGKHILFQFAFATALVLIIAHTISKSLLFISVGHAKEALGSENINDVRGIWSSVGITPAAGILVSGLSFSAFPPFIGFVGEWMFLELIFQSFKFANTLSRLTATFAGIFSALAIGLAAFSMIKLAGYTALGFDHGKKSKKIHSVTMKITELSLLIIVIGSGIFVTFILRYFGYTNFTSGLLAVFKPMLLISGNPPFGVISPAFFMIIILVLLLFPLLVYFSRHRNTRRVNSWNGGIPLTEDEYFTSSAYSGILKIILNKFYGTKETKGREKKIVIVDKVRYFYSWLNKFVLGTGYLLSKVLMNGKVYAYVSYIIVMFVLVFLIV
ncbi:MAG: NADH/ubiquinone/plastoquinone (complex I) [Spirochaetes bacterium]|nr:NADH/ubiquinone/plastoquinone (complex I) [Spirochaetota bacterium]